jgi:hypothetical protein
MPEIFDDVTDSDDDTESEIEKFQRLFPIKPGEAIEQAAEFLGFMSGIQFDIGDGKTWTLPNPSLLEDEQADRYNQVLVDLQAEAERLDRAPDILNDDGSFKSKGAILTPERIDGVIVPNQDVRIAKALMGEDVFAKFKAAGGRASQITIHWQQMGKFMRDRERRDPKSTRSDSAVVPVSN